MASIGVAVFLAAFIVIAAIALIVLLGAWVYRDANSKDMSGLLWMVVVLLVPSFIGLIIYLIVRMDNQKVVCSSCNQPVSGKNKFCSNCGEELKPVVDVTVEDESFKKSQRKILIGFFTTLAAIIIMAIMMVAFMITGVIKIAGDTIAWVTKLDTSQWEESLEDTLGDLDVLFDEDEIHISVQDEVVTLTDKDGNELIHVDGNSESVDVNLKDLKALMEKYHIEYDENMSEEELEEALQEEIEKQVEKAVEKTLDDMN